jgi:hypothetical protein
MSDVPTGICNNFNLQALAEGDCESQTGGVIVSIVLEEL